MTLLLLVVGLTVFLVQCNATISAYRNVTSKISPQGFASLTECRNTVGNGELLWDLKESTTLFEIVNYENSLQVKPTTMYTKLARLRNNFVTESGENKEYCLEQISVHIREPMSIDFIHYSCDYQSIEDAMNNNIQTKDKFVLAVVSIMFEIGNPNPFMTKIIESQTSLIDANISALIPAFNDYIYYEGSLPKRSLNRNVRWHIPLALNTMSAEQIWKLQAKYAERNPEPKPQTIAETQLNVCHSNGNRRRLSGEKLISRMSHILNEKSDHSNSDHNFGSNIEQPNGHNPDFWRVDAFPSMGMYFLFVFIIILALLWIYLVMCPHNIGRDTRIAFKYVETEEFDENTDDEQEHGKKLSVL